MTTDNQLFLQLINCEKKQNIYIYGILINMSDSVKIYPTESELNTVEKHLTCSECSKIFKSKSSLNLHLAKTHRKVHLLESSKMQKLYFCPVNACCYHTLPHFKQMKLLKQHYLKVHCEKNYLCHLCNKGFTIEASRNRHTEYCEIQFKCCDCDAFYESYETLKTHCRRKNHKILQKIAYKSNNVVPNYIVVSPEITTKSKRLLLPKTSNINVFIIAGTMEQSSQTEKHNIVQFSQETQTIGINRIKRTSETQTFSEDFSGRIESSDNRSIKTQTCATTPRTVSCNTSFNLSEYDIMNEIQRNSSSTQTSSDFFSSSTNTHDTIHTETPDILADTMDSNYFFSNNMETQTDFMFDDDLFKCCDDYNIDDRDYSNMYTQTCTELLGDMEFTQNQTQTVLEAVLKSVESQTIMSHSKRIPLSCKDMSHMETQTDMHFKQMLEQINT